MSLAAGKIQSYGLMHSEHSCMLTASDEPSIHELQHLHWNCFLLKALALESTANRNFFSNTGDALIFQSDDSDIFASGFVPNNIPGGKIGVHRVPLGRVATYLAMRIISQSSIRDSIMMLAEKISSRWDLNCL
jgi:hypothetical protein